MFCGEAMQIPVSRKWLEQMGAAIQGTAPTPTTPTQPEPEEEQKISFTLHQ
jgi:hypothetical protein